MQLKAAVPMISGLLGAPPLLEWVICIGGQQRWLDLAGKVALDVLVLDLLFHAKSPSAEERH